MRWKIHGVWSAVALAALLTAGCGQTDAGITTAVESRLAADDSVPADEINVETSDGVVTLTGSVDTNVARIRAVEIARETRGVREVVNELHATPGAAGTTGIGDPASDPEHGVRTTDPQWREGAEARAGDAAVTTAVRTSLMEDSSLADLSIDVSTRENVVTLSGAVPSQTEKHRAIELARETEGVRSVVDRLRIDPKK
jgi:hyperosmotically inducible periplasmic protein